jgi:hypothetical protein
LYDEQRGSVVAVDGLLSLLGESLVLMEQQELLLSVSQIVTLMKAVEDISTVHPRIRSRCEEFLSKTIQACYQTSSSNMSFSSLSSSQGPTTRSRTNGHSMTIPKLDKNISNLTNSSGGFSLIGSSLMHRSSGSFSSLAFTGSSNATADARSVGTASAPNSLQSSGFLVMPTLASPTDLSLQVIPSDVSRGWDWRVPTQQLGGENFSGDDVLRILRVALAKEISRAWMVGQW